MAKEMKDSGIEWIGQIPSDWKITRLKFLFEIGLGLTHTPNYVDSGVPFISVKDISKGTLILDNVKYISEKEFNTFPRSAIPQKGDIIFGRVGTIGVPYIYDKNIKVGMFISLGKLSNMNPMKINTSFMLYYVLSEIFEIETKIKITGAAQVNLNSEWLKEYALPQPPINEQKKIVDFLDKKCAEIDSLSLDIQSQISILEDYKKSVITEAVTKGLNLDVEMKDSGIEWIGEIPKHWEVAKIKYLFKNGKGLSITKENLIDSGLAVVSYGQIHSKTNTGVTIENELLRFVDYKYQNNYPQCQVYKYDFIFADTSEDYEGCGNCVYKRDDLIVFAGYHTIILHSTKQQDNRYFAYLFKTDCWRKQIREVASGVKLFSITQKTLINSSILVPLMDEQCKIADYLDKKCAEIDAIITKKREQLDVLEQYKKSMIYEYVTGKKEVIND